VGCSAAVGNSTQPVRGVLDGYWLDQRKPEQLGPDLGVSEEKTNTAHGWHDRRHQKKPLVTCASAPVPPPCRRGREEPVPPTYPLVSRSSPSMANEQERDQAATETRTVSRKVRETGPLSLTQLAAGP
jgi:hypothetical protein